MPAPSLEKPSISSGGLYHRMAELGVRSSRVWTVSYDPPAAFRAEPKLPSLRTPSLVTRMFVGSMLR
jgi:hypothetical protein